MGPLSATVLAALIGAAPPDAKAGTIAGTTPWSQLTRVGLEFDAAMSVYPYTGVATWVLDGQVELIPGLFLGGRFGLGYVWIDPPGGFGGGDQATYSNIPISVHYAKTVVKDTLAFHVGGRIAAPLLADPSLEVIVASGASVLPAAYWGADTFIPRYLPIRVGGGIEAGFPAGPGAVLVRADVYPHLFVPLFDNSEAEFVIETAAEGEWRHTSGFGAGLRLQPIVFPKSLANGGDGMQLALQPFVGFVPEAMPLYARFGVLVALDEPLGVATGRDAMVSFRFAVGWKLPK